MESAGASERLPDAPCRIVIERVEPEVDGGRFPIKRVVGERVVVEADVFGDGHDAVACVLRYRHAEERDWSEAPMRYLGNDRWRGEFPVRKVGAYIYGIQAWTDEFGSWLRDLGKRVDAGQELEVELRIGAGIVARAAAEAPAPDAGVLREWAARLERGTLTPREHASLGEEIAGLLGRWAVRRNPATLATDFTVTVDPERARFSAWYEMFPRSASAEPGRHGTFADCELRIPYVARMGFDVLYLPPIHPIGTSRRKGRNNSVACGPGDVGSPWAIGSPAGGHDAVHPELGTLEDFRRLVSRAREHGIDVAIDIAFQCSPDHPWVLAHPEWFRRRPDGTIQYAENPPKKYQDIFPFDFECADWRNLWLALLGVVRLWGDQGVRVFRVDNPHTKPLRFWGWLIAEVKRERPETIFLAEAFTRPKVMRNLAKRGFTQSYTYFTWRNSARELREYFEELTRSESREYFRPNAWPNTPDILPEFLQFGGKPAFRIRFVLAATLAASYGIYGPAFELCENRAVAPHTEEYLDSEKYELRRWDVDAPGSLAALIARVNRIRRDHPALQSNDHLVFHGVSNDQILCYSKATPDFSSIVLVVANLSPHHRHSGWIDLEIDALGIDPSLQYQVHDLLSDARYLWRGRRNYVELDPAESPAHIFALRRHVRREHDFDYYM